MKIYLAHAGMSPDRPDKMPWQTRVVMREDALAAIAEAEQRGRDEAQAGIVAWLCDHDLVRVYGFPLVTKDIAVHIELGEWREGMADSSTPDKSRYKKDSTGG